MADKDVVTVRVSWIQPLLTFVGMFSAIIVSYMLTRSDVRDLGTIQRLEKEKQALIDSAQDKHTVELQSLVEQNTKSQQQLTNRLDNWVMAIERSSAEAKKRQQQ